MYCIPRHWTPLWDISYQTAKITIHCWLFALSVHHPVGEELLNYLKYNTSWDETKAGANRKPAAGKYIDMRANVVLVNNGASLEGAYIMPISAKCSCDRKDRLQVVNSLQVCLLEEINYLIAWPLRPSTVIKKL